MAKTITMSFSVPVELSIQMEEYMENEKITRSDLIKKALEFYIGLKESNKESVYLIKETYTLIKEISEKMKKE